MTWPWLKKGERDSQYDQGSEDQKIQIGPNTYKNSREEKSRTRLDRDHKFQEILDKFGPGLDQKSWTSSDLNQHISKLKDRLGLEPKKFWKSRIGLSPAD